jgi:hypothetical protein
VTRDDQVHHDLDADTLAQLYAIVEPALSAGPLPEFGSSAWLELPNDDPRRAWATLRAALTWWTWAAFGMEIPEMIIAREITARMSAASKQVAGHEPEWRRRRGAA